MYKDIVAERGVIPCEPVSEFNPNGKFYKMNPELGKGHCWVYQCNPYVTITIMNQIHYEDTCCTFEQPEYYKKYLSEQYPDLYENPSEAFAQIDGYPDFLSHIACMSQAKLKYIFKDVYRMNIQQYIDTRRITHAEHLLRDTVLPVSQIVEMVGYKHISSLSDMFRQHTGMKPTEYREKMQMIINK